MEIVNGVGVGGGEDRLRLLHHRAVIVGDDGGVNDGDERVNGVRGVVREGERGADDICAGGGARFGYVFSLRLRRRRAVAWSESRRRRRWMLPRSSRRRRRRGRRLRREAPRQRRVVLHSGSLVDAAERNFRLKLNLKKIK